MSGAVPGIDYWEVIMGIPVSPVLTPVGAILAGDVIRISNPIWGVSHHVDAIKPLGNGEYTVQTHATYRDERGEVIEHKTRTFHGEFPVWLVEAVRLFND